MSWLPILLSAGALALGFVAWTDSRAIKTTLDKRLGAMDAQLMALQTKVNAAPRPQAAPQGPDPAKSYPIKVAGSPSKGNPTAPIVIAEFSDYQ
jgi:protein-disulfide isomerase